MTVKKMNFTKLLFLGLFAFFTTNLLAQNQNQNENENENQTTRTSRDLDKDEDFEKRWKKTPNRYHNWNINFGGNSGWDNDNWGGVRVGLIDLGFSTYFHEGSLNLPEELDDFDQNFGGSLNINLHLIRHRLPIIKNRVGLEYGLTIAWKQYRFSNDFRILEDTIPFTVVDDGTSYRKNKLKTTFLEVPLMLTITGKRNFYLSGGIYGGVLLGSKQKLRDEDGNRFRIRDDFNLNKYRYGVIGRIGFGPFAVYAQLAMNDLFREGQGPELTPFNVGISLLDF